MPTTSEPRTIEAFERDMAVYGAGSPQERARVLTQLSCHRLIRAQRRLASSLGLLKNWNTRESTRQGDAMHWPGQAPVAWGAPPAPSRPDRATRDQAGARPVIGELSPRQREIAALIRHGLTNQEIAARLVLAPGTVANYVAAIRTRLDCRNRAQLASWATEHGLDNGRPDSEQP